MQWLVISIICLWILNAACAKVSQVFLGGSVTEANDKNGAVASESKTCSQIGIDLMKAGGNAADAVGFSSLQANLDLHIGRSWEQPFVLALLVSKNL